MKELEAAARMALESESKVKAECTRLINALIAGEALPEPSLSLLRELVVPTKHEGELQVPEGFALVPVEPTPAMKSAGIEVEIYNEAADRIGALTWHEVASIYRAMLDAARKGE